MRPRLEGPEVRTITVQDVMNPDVITVRDDMTLQEAALFLVEHQISGAPVEDSEGRLIGVVSFTDIARAAAEMPQLDAPPPEPAARLPEYFTRLWEEPAEAESLPDPPAAGVAVRDIMTPELYSVAEKEPVSVAARLMLDAHIHRLLVTHGHKVTGIVTTSDLLRLLVEAG